MLAHSCQKHVEERNKHTKKNCEPSWLYLQDCKLKISITVQGDHIEYLNMMPVVKLPVNSHELISLYELYSHTCWILGKEYDSLYKQ